MHSTAQQTVDAALSDNWELQEPHVVTGDTTIKMVNFTLHARVMPRADGRSVRSIVVQPGQAVPVPRGWALPYKVANADEADALIYTNYKDAATGVPIWCTLEHYKSHRLKVAQEHGRAPSVAECAHPKIVLHERMRKAEENALPQIDPSVLDIETPEEKLRAMEARMEEIAAKLASVPSPDEVREMRARLAAFEAAGAAAVAPSKKGAGGKGKKPTD